MPATGIFSNNSGAVFCYPATPKHRLLVRLTFNAGHTEADVDRLIEAGAGMRDEVELGSWSSTRRLTRAKPTTAPNHSLARYRRLVGTSAAPNQP